MIKDLYNKAKGLRSVLHENAEVSNMEYKTKIILMDYLRDNTSVEIHDFMHIVRLIYQLKEVLHFVLILMR